MFRRQSSHFECRSRAGDLHLFHDQLVIFGQGGHGELRLHEDHLVTGELELFEQIPGRALTLRWIWPTQDLLAKMEKAGWLRMKTGRTAGRSQSPGAARLRVLRDAKVLVKEVN
jgi:hypothetical protein